MEANPSATQASSSSLGKILNVVLVLGVMYIAYLYFVDRSISFSVSENLLEKATKIGVSTKADYSAFKNAGGVENAGVWRGFTVRTVDAVHHPDGKLAIVKLVLPRIKGVGATKLPSLDALAKELTKDCGSAWETMEASSRQTILKETSAAHGIQCSAYDDGDYLITVNMLQVPKDQAAAPAPQPAAVAPAVQPAPVAAQPTGDVQKQVLTEDSRIVLTATPSAPEFKTVLTVDGKQVFDSKDYELSFAQAVKSGSNTVVLLSIAAGGNACPASYRIVTVPSSGQAHVTEDFGTCSDIAKLTVSGSTASVVMPNMGKGGESEWRLDGTKLSQVRDK